MKSQLLTLARQLKEEEIPLNDYSLVTLEGIGIVFD